MIRLDCPKCSRSNPLTEEELFLFYPRFYCLTCGEKLRIPLSPEEYLRLAHATDLDRRVESYHRAAAPTSTR
ncbi:MAG: hypothetical protein HY716_13145 [Planctomycetes bacterium]|nr:hypothetical protein [Planctomycetota bacterium]